MSPLEHATEKFLTEIKTHGFTEITIKPIAYGNQIQATLNGERANFRIYYSKKKGVTRDFSQVKSETIKTLFNAPPPKSHQKKALHDVPEGFDFFSIGSDETGKGDLIGPLIVAAVYVDETLSKTFKLLGVKDSKDITSKKILKDLYTQIVATAPHVIKVIEPAEYNTLYKVHRNINKIMALTHRAALQELVAQGHTIKRVIIDRFSKNDYFKDAFSKDLDVVQLPRAEQFMSVAAASILARYTQLEYYRVLNLKFKKRNIVFYPGMNPKNRGMLHKYLDDSSEQSLFYLTKLHFKTINEILRERRERTLNLKPKLRPEFDPEADIEL